MTRPLAWSLLGIILLLALYLRCHRLGEHGFWLDENYSAELSTGRGYAHFDLPTNQLIVEPVDLEALSRQIPWWHVLTQQGRDVHPPLYFLVLRGWRGVFGSSDIEMRMLSVLCSVAAAGVMYAVGALLYGRTAGLWVALLMSLSMSQIELGRQVRDYALLVLLGAIALLVVVRIEKCEWRMRRGIVLTGVIVASLAVHWLASGFLFGLALYVALAWRQRKRRNGLICFAIAGAIVGVTLLPLQIHQMQHAATWNWWLADRQPHHAVRVLTALGDLPLRFFGLTYGTSKLYLAWWIIFLLAPILAVRGRRDLLLASLALYGTLLFLVSVDLLHHTVASMQTRYGILMVAPMCLIVVGIFRTGRRGGAILGNLFPPAVALFSAVALLSYYNEPINEDWRKLAQSIARETRPGEPIIFASPRQQDPEALPSTAYLCASRYLPPGHPIVLADRPMVPAEVTSLHAGSVCIFSGWSMGMPSTIVPGAQVEDIRWLWPVGYVGRVRLPEPPLAH